MSIRLEWHCPYCKKLRYIITEIPLEHLAVSGSCFTRQCEVHKKWYYIILNPLDCLACGFCEATENLNALMIQCPNHDPEQ